jgi:hypothetical protein
MGAFPADFMRHGVCSVDVGALDIGDAEWKRLTEAVSATTCPYEEITHEKRGAHQWIRIARFITDEPLPAETKHPVTRLAADVIAREVVTRRVCELTGFEHLRLRRVQAHVLEPGNFLDPHIDNGANPLWDISTICGFESASQGGTLVVEAEDGSKISYDGSAGTVVLFRANLRHEITRVISGQRRTLACWYSRSDAPNPARS